MAKAGVTYTIGRESNELYNEKFNGVCLSRLAGKYNGQVKRTSEWPVAIDPYVKPGSPSSGLLPEINAIEYKPDGTGDKRVPSSYFPLAMTQEKDNMLPFYATGTHNPGRSELTVRHVIQQHDQ